MKLSGSINHPVGPERQIKLGGSINHPFGPERLSFKKAIKDRCSTVKT
jgi:hypothetical protein